MAARAVRGRVATALVTLCTLALLALPGTSAPAAAVTPEIAGPTVVVTGMAPAAVTPESIVTIDVSVTNPTSAELEAPRVDLSIVRYRISTRSVLDAWYLEDQYLVAPGLVAREDVAPLAAGETRSVRLTVPAETLGLLTYPEAAGPRGLIVTLADDGVVLDETRTFLLWQPEVDPDPMDVSIVAPVTARTTGVLEDRARGLTGEVASGGRLDAVLQATRGQPGVTWAVDPALVEDAAAGLAGDAGVAWAQALVAAAEGRDVYALDPYDPDVAALAHADVEPFLTSSSRTPGSAVTEWREDLTLPGPGAVDLETLTAAVREDRGTVVLEAPDELSTGTPTPDALATWPTAAGPATTLTPDAELSALLQGTVPDVARSAFEARQLMLAELAIVSFETDGPEHLLLVAGRSWHPDAVDTTTTLTAIDQAPFVDLRPLSEWAAEPGGAFGADVPPQVVAPGEVSARALQRADELADEARRVAQVAADPDALLEPYLSTLAAASSVALRGESASRAALLTSAEEQGRSIATGLTVVEGSTVNLIAASGDLPVTLRNDLGQPVTVGVMLRPSDPRLKAEPSEQVTIEPGTTASVTVPVTAIGSGNVDVDVQVLAVDGAVVAAPAQFTVRVRADWESTGTAVVGVALLVLLVAGITRTVRRGRSASRMAPMRPEEEAT